MLTKAGVVLVVAAADKQAIPYSGALKMARSHVWSQDIIVSASLSTTYELLRNVQHFDQLTSAVGDLTQMASASDDTAQRCRAAGQGRSLFLRDTIICTSSCQAPDQVTILMDDGFSVVQYTFHLREVGPECTSVLCEVDCRTRLGDQWSGPSERLARMMQKQDSNLGQRLKGYVESASRSVPVF